MQPSVYNPTLSLGNTLQIGFLPASYSLAIWYVFLSSFYPSHGSDKPSFLLSSTSKLTFLFSPFPSVAPGNITTSSVSYFGSI